MIRKKLLAAIALALVTVAGCSTDDDDSANAAAPATDAIGSGVDMSAVETFSGLTPGHSSGLTQGHTDHSVDYAQSPPVGGDHDPAWQNCGVYDEPVRNENAVHSLEHGAVWLAYAPDLSDADVEVLRAFARGQTHVLVSPYDDLRPGEAVVATAWGTQLRLESVNDPRLAVFVATYQEGPQTPELGVTCSGAVGAPIE